MSSITYTTSGRFYGTCGHQHKSARAAGACVRQHQAACKRNNGYSDRKVYRSDGELLTDSEDREVSRGLGVFD